MIVSSGAGDFVASASHSVCVRAPSPPTDTAGAPHPVIAVTFAAWSPAAGDVLLVLVRHH